MRLLPIPLLLTLLLPLAACDAARTGDAAAPDINGAFSAVLDEAPLNVVRYEFRQRGESVTGTFSGEGHFGGVVQTFSFPFTGTYRFPYLRIFYEGLDEPEGPHPNGALAVVSDSGDIIRLYTRDESRAYAVLHRVRR